MGLGVQRLGKQFAMLNILIVAQLVKNPPAMRKTWVPSLGWEDPLEKGMTTHSSILVFWPGEFHGLYSPWGRKQQDTTERLSLLPCDMRAQLPCGILCPVHCHLTPNMSMALMVERNSGSGLVKVAQSCLTLCGILQARIPEWVAFPFSRGSSQPRY